MDNIWDNYNFDENQGKSILDYIKEHKESLFIVTKGILKMEVDSFFDGKTKHLVYIICPHLGNYRKKIMTIIEVENYSYFPVSIKSSYDDFEEIKNIDEESFTDKFNSVLLQNKIIIENLYRQSLEGIKNSK